jgi:hypothetical protein
MLVCKMAYFQLLPIFRILSNIICYVNNNLLAWSEYMKLYFKWHNYIIKDSFPLQTKECVYFLNHRESADFAIDAYLTEGRAFFISRWFVFLVTPFMGLLTLIGNGVYYFSRTKNIDKKQFVMNVEAHRLHYSDYKSVNVYPEGTRRFENDCVRIKDGGIYYSYVYMMPIQIIITKNKEFVFSLKTWSSRDNVNCYTYRSDVIYPGNFNTLGEYRTFVCEEWIRCWDIVYKKEYTPEMCEPFVPNAPTIAPSNRTLMKLYIGRIIIMLGVLFTHYFLKIFDR